MKVPNYATHRSMGGGRKPKTYATILYLPWQLGYGIPQMVIVDNTFIDSDVETMGVVNFELKRRGRSLERIGPKGSEERNQSSGTFRSGISAEHPKSDGF